MRRREISPEFWTDEKVVGITDAAKLLFIGLWNLADREGRLEDKPLTIGFKVRPWAPSEVGGLLDELGAAGLVRRYEAAGGRFLWIPKFAEHQRIHPKEMGSRIPPCNSTASPGTPEPTAESSEIMPGSSGSSLPSGSTGPSGAAAEHVRRRLNIVDDPPLPPARHFEKPESPPEGWDADEFFSWFQAERVEGVEGLLQERPPHPRRLSAWWSEARGQCTVEQLQAAAHRFGDDPYWRRGKPPIPFGGFMSQWSRFVTPEARDAVL